MSIDSTSAGSKSTVPAVGDTLCACPKHPEGQQNHSGSCPKCGMTLEP
jgi:P-type Cu+ transporter